MEKHDPKLRILEDQDGDEADVVRLEGGIPAEPEEKPVPLEAPERLVVAVREAGPVRSLEPGVEVIMTQEEPEKGLEEVWGENQGKPVRVPHGWLWLLGLAVVGGGIWAVATMRRGEQQLDLDRATIQEKVDDEVMEERTALALVNRVEQVVDSFLAADNVGELLPLVRQPDRVKPLIEAHAKERPKKSQSFVRMAAFQPATLDNHPFWAVRAEVAGGDHVDLLLEQVGDTEVKVDWESFVCYQPMDWDRYAEVKKDVGPMDFRVWVVMDSHFIHEFSDSGRWRCFRLNAKDSKSALYGYAEAGSEVEKKLTAYCLANRLTLAPAILRLRAPEGGEAEKAVLIEEVVTLRWQHVDDPAKNSP
ncbi:hypothetical protein [Luteolibacter marinus]|uniref:hypothetical protein n=1 Tax=Luteolibacter marinus TaxID=2776705 RepID=UPI0018676F4F|nr:hypothetical protein [Luteolibacter marinus]